MTGGAPAPTVGPRTAALLERVDQLAAAVERAGDRVPPDVAQTVLAGVTAVRERLQLGVDHTVVALVGGTGSGKSSLFNALSGLDLADVGVKRPTTAAVTACAWAHDATSLLDWLGVARDRRMDRESELDGESQADLRGLVLLDLPDYDSIEAQHRAVVDRLLPLVDLLVWVVDPQKYADDALHTGYLSELSGHEGAMAVVLNQIDTVPVDAQAGLLRDVSRLLAEDGLTGVGVLSVSARTGAGVPVLREALAKAVAAKGMAETRAEAEVADAARALATTVGTSAEAQPVAPRERAVQALVEAAGLDGVIAAVQQAVRAGRSPDRVRFGPVQPDRVALVRDGWLADAGAGVPERWQSALAHAVPPAGRLVEATDDRLSRIVPSASPARTLQVLARVAVLVGMVALLGVGLTAGSALGDDGWGRQTTTLGVLTAGAAVVVIALLRWRAWLRADASRRAAEEVSTGARSALLDVVDEVLVRPSFPVLDDHRLVRQATEVPPPAAGRHKESRRAV